MSNLAGLNGFARQSRMGKGLFVIPFLTLGLSFLSAMRKARINDSEWYQDLTKPEGLASDKFFAVIWPILYFLLGMAIATVAFRGKNGMAVKTPGILWALVILLVLLLLWPIFFTSTESTRASAVYMLIVLIFTFSVMIACFARNQRAAAGMLLPLFIWLVYATIIAFQLSKLNPEE